MADKIERIIADTFLQMAEGLETGNFGKKPKIALTGMGSEHGEENAMEAAKMLLPKMELRYITSEHWKQKALLLLRWQMMKKVIRRWKNCWHLRK